MIYKLENNNIKVFDKTQFNPQHILECGQVFRFGKDKNGNYYLSETQLTRDEIVKRAIAMRGENPQLTITISGDTSADYGAVNVKVSQLWYKYDKTKKLIFYFHDN